jgi:hypothetical protein
MTPPNLGAWESVGLSHSIDAANRREFFLYWAGFLIVILGSISVLMTISGLMIEVLNYRCWYPVLSPLFGFSEPSNATQGPNMLVYCANPAVAVVRFIFNFLTGLIVVGAGIYMMLNGKKR